jgi:Cu-processing system ATP-binding protein
MSAAAEWRKVGKRYGPVIAVEDVSLELRAGEVTALVGQNGAGKTTLIKLLLGLVRPDTGDVRISGRDPAGSSGSHARRALGFLPENVAFHGAMTGRELMAFYARLKRVSTARNAELLARVGIAHAADRRVGTYSKGMRQRLGVAQALIGDPQLLVFDEPTSGLDPASRRDVFDMIDTLRASGATVLLSTHGLVEVEERVDRVVIMHRGRLRAAGTLEELRSESRAKARIVVRTRPCCTGQVLAALPAGASCLHRSDTGLTLEVKPQDKVALVRAVLAAGDVVEDVEMHTAGLQELYRDLVDEPDEDA